MEQNGIVAYREKLQQVVDKYGDFLGEEVSRLGAEHGIPTAEKLQADLAAIAEEERLLRIGIVGRVKSGKSSLLNALIFGGESVLPKAATPMTAALTTLSYGDAMQAEVEFFTRGDIEDIAAKAGEYERLLKKKTDELLKKQKSRSLTNLRGQCVPREQGAAPTQGRKGDARQSSRPLGFPRTTRQNKKGAAYPWGVWRNGRC